MRRISKPKVFYKFGYTESEDAVKRFTEEYHNTRSFANVCLGRDYTPICLWSAYVTKDKASQMEIRWKEQYPRDFWTAENYNGIGECRKLDEVTIKDLLTKLYNWKKSYKPSPGLRYKVYLMKFIKKEDPEELETVEF